MSVLSPEQIEVVREIALLKTVAQAASLVDGLTSAQQTMLQAIVDTDWPAIRYKVGHLVPNSDDILNSFVEKRRLIIHRVRMMLGLDPVSDAEIQMAELDGTFGKVIGYGGGGGGGRSATSTSSEVGVISTGVPSRRSNNSELG